MNIKKHRNTWQKPWSYREGTIISFSIILLGFAFQAVTGGMLIRPAGFPWNLISGLIFILLLVTSYWVFKKHPVMHWLGSVKAALPAILTFTALVLLMGFIKQDVAPQSDFARLLGLNQLIKTWPFILINIYLMILLGIVTLKRLTPFNLKNAGFFINHFGLFLVLFSTALGSGDVQRLSMNCYQGQPEWRAVDGSGAVTELPLAIELKKFNIDEFRPKVAVIDNTSGKILELKGKSQLELLDRDSFELAGYRIVTGQFLESSGKLGDAYFQVNEPGSVNAAKLRVTELSGKGTVEGWISNGSYVRQPEALKLNANHSLVMLPAEARKFSSELSIRTKSGKDLNTVIEVNKPFEVDGWKIYQLSYDTELGRWSNLSVLELVKDPWLPVVYLGIFLMMAGAVFLFIFGKPNEGGTKHVA